MSQDQSTTVPERDDISQEQRESCDPVPDHEPPESGASGARADLVDTAEDPGASEPPCNFRCKTSVEANPKAKPEANREHAPPAANQLDPLRQQPSFLVPETPEKHNPGASETFDVPGRKRRLKGTESDRKTASKKKPKRSSGPPKSRAQAGQE